MKAGRFHVEHPTLLNLGFEWAIDGDANRNAAVAVQFGPRQEPSFTGILQAYYGAGLGDWSVVWERRAQAGDVLLLHAGRYKPERLNYVDPMMTPFDGSRSLTLEGTPDKPITIKAAGDGALRSGPHIERRGIPSQVLDSAPVR